ncbi:hypothetical protein BDW62DRAFT_214063 [Aspergillus aurantiobrunneus]
MADTTQQALPSGEQPRPTAESGDTAPTEPSHTHTNDSSHPAIDTSLPPIDKTLPTSDTSLPAIDTSVASMDSTIPALPPIDTSLPPLDTTMPAMDDLHGTEAHFSFDTRFDEEGSGDGVVGNGTTGLEHQITEQHGHSQDPATSNGVHPQPTGQHQHYEQHPQHPQQNVRSQQLQAQMPQQPQQQSQQPPDMYHNHNSASPPLSNPSMQGQPSHIPQAPIGSPMPAMASVSQYMAGYPSQMGMSPGGQMHYQLQGDANKMLSSRHKKEVKRRTKTGCLTCRKRRIKVRKQFLGQCDEGHPVCRNCVKSKRECLGYDPVFKQPTPSAIQPAPNPQPSLVVNPQDPSPSVSPGFPVAAKNYLISSPVKQVQISDLLALRGIPPPPPHPITSLPPNRLEEIQAVFLATYAPAIDRFFETRWFSEKALGHLLANAQLMAEYSALIEAFNGNLSDPNVIARLESFEASVVWSTMTLCRHVMNVSNGSQQDYDLLATSKRLDVIEAVITGDHLDSNPLAQFPTREPAANPPSLPDQLTQRQLDFWSAIGHFLTLHDNEASAAKEIDDTLGRCRTLLDTYENRDVIYSIAIARHLGQRWADFPHSFPQPITTNEKDAGAKLYVAQKFLEQEAGGKGTTQVVKRLCGMVVRSWFVSRE